MQALCQLTSKEPQQLSTQILTAALDRSARASVRWSADASLLHRRCVLRTLVSTIRNDLKKEWLWFSKDMILTFTEQDFRNNFPAWEKAVDGLFAFAAFNPSAALGIMCNTLMTDFEKFPVGELTLNGMGERIEQYHTTVFQGELIKEIKLQAA